jgi:hypothetical protein
MARALGPIPVRVTIVTPPAAANPLSSADVDSATTGSIGTAPWPSPATEVPAALLPRVPTSLIPVPPVQVPLPKAPPTQVPTSQALATQASTAERPSTEGLPAPASTAHKHERPSDPKTLAGHSGTRAEARSGTRAVRRNAQPQPEQAFSLKNWLQQLGTRPRNTGG